MFASSCQPHVRKLRYALCITAALSVFSLCASEVFAQTPVPQSNSAPVVAAQAQSPARLTDLLTEAEQKNPQIQAAHQAWIAAQQMPAEVSALPDPQVQVQEFSVGSPRPFAGYTNSDFAYIGLGASQEFPYPGKLHLKGQIAKQDAAVAQEQYESVRRDVLANVKSAYFQLAYLSQTLAILESDGELLNEAEQAGDARYRSGMGNQQDLLQAQLEKTKLLREITMHHLEVAKLEAQLKQLLDRSQSSPDIETTQISQTPLTYTFDELLNAAKSQNPEIAAAQSLIQKGKLQVDLVHKDFYPDFSLQYMWQRTDPAQFRAYYMLTFGVSIPIHRSKLHHELAEAEADLDRSRSEAHAQSEQVAFQLRTEYDTAQKDAELLSIYSSGLMPQARAEYQAGVASYQNNRSDFQTLLNSFLDVLHLDEEYWQTFADHEDALAGIEQLTGLSLRQEGQQ